jgi:hypothetical protein
MATIIYNHFTRQYNPEDSSEHHTRRRENLKSHMNVVIKQAAGGGVGEGDGLYTIYL